MFLEKNIKRINILFIILIVLGGLCYNTVAHNLVMKTAASSGFFLLGIINTVYGFKNNWGKRDFCVLMTAGFAVMVAADIVLEIEFIIGALIFAIGHIIYFSAYCRLAPAKINDFVISAVLFAASAGAILFLPIFDFGGTFMQTVCVVYAAIISVMFGKAFSNRKKVSGKLAMIIATGSFLFVVSDLMLLFDYFSDAPKIVNRICVNTYYPAQALLAFSVLKTDK